MSIAPLRRSRSAILGLLACFLGWTGLHNWLLGQKKRALGHLALTLICFGLIILAVQVGDSAASLAQGSSDRLLRFSVAATTALGALAILILGYLVGICNAAWGFVEGVIIISRGDPIRRPAAAGAAYPSPAARRKFLLGGLFAGAALLIAIIAAVVIALVCRPDYAASYQAARSLREKIAPLYQDYSCNRVVDYVNSTWSSEKVYDSYIADCKAVFDGTDQLVAELGETSGIRYDSDLSALYQTFRTLYDQTAPDPDQFDRQLELYRIWHTFTLRVDSLTPSSPDSEFSAAAAGLLESGNDTLAEYGTGWLDKTLDYIHAYQTYAEAELGDERTHLREEMLAQQSAQRTWVSEHRPSLIELTGLNFSDTAKLYQSFRNLYNAISDAYVDDYDINA